MSESLLGLARRLAELGVRGDQVFREPRWLEEALTHSSFAAENGTSHNERLEMLGDAVLGFLVAELLFDLFPNVPEGVLTRLRASLVEERALASKARELNLGRLLRLGHGEELTGGRERDSLLADAFEAVLAGLYRSEGLGAACALVSNLFRADALSRGAASPQPRDFKTQLQERAQAAFKETPEYRIVESAGPAHARTFVAEVVLGGRMAGRGGGRSKKHAEQQAARAALASFDDLAQQRQKQ